MSEPKVFSRSLRQQSSIVQNQRSRILETSVRRKRNAECATLDRGMFSLSIMSAEEETRWLLFRKDLQAAKTAQQLSGEHGHGFILRNPHDNSNDHLLKPRYPHGLNKDGTPILEPAFKDSTQHPTESAKDLSPIKSVINYLGFLGKLGTHHGNAPGGRHGK